MMKGNRTMKETAVMTSPIGDLPINSDGLRKAIDEIRRLQNEIAKLKKSGIDTDKSND